MYRSQILIIMLALCYCIGCGGNAKAPEEGTVNPTPITETDKDKETAEAKKEVQDKFDIYLYRSDDPTVVVELYGKEITMGQIDTMALSVLKKKGISPLTKEGKEELRRIRPNIMEAITTNMLLYHLASEAGVIVSDASVEELFQRYRSQKSTAEEFEETLAIDGLTPETFREQIRDEIMTRNFMALKMGDILSEPVSDEEIEKYYNENPEDFGDPGSAHIAHIYIEAYDFMSKDKRNAAKKTIETIYNLLLAGANFEELASQYSNDEKSRSRNGDMGWIKKGNLFPALDNSIFKTKKGEITTILEGPDGFHIFKVLDKKFGKVPPLSEVKGMIKQKLEETQMLKGFDQWIKEEKEKADIKITNYGIWNRIANQEDIY